MFQVLYGIVVAEESNSHFSVFISSGYFMYAASIVVVITIIIAVACVFYVSDSRVFDAKGRRVPGPNSYMDTIFKLL